MKTLFLTAATAALIFAAPAAFAADDHHDAHPGGEHAAHTAPAHSTTHMATTHMAKPAPAMTMSGPKHTGKHSRHTMPTTMSTHAPTSFGTADHNGRDNHDNDNHGTNSRGGTHVSINFNRHNVTASHHYHYRGGAYRGPSGYSYHRYSYGDTLPSIYFARDYWVSDYSDYGLSDPPDGCVWVRYGNDAVLIEEDNGEILEVVYGQFY